MSAGHKTPDRKRRSAREIDQHGLYQAVLETERLRTTADPIAVVGYINLQLAIRRRSARALTAYRMALLGVRQAVAAEVTESDLDRCAASLRKQSIDDETDLRYLQEYCRAFPWYTPFRDLLSVARTKWRTRR
jgi:hypothetical protein